MNPEPLQRDLRELEAQLSRRPGPGPSPELRARIVSAIQVPPPRPSRGWRFIAAAALVALILNIVLSVGNGVWFNRMTESGELTPPAPSPAADVPDTNDSFERYAASALASLRPSAGPGAADRSLFTREEKRQWDTP
jgi:hypothetical protein